MPNPAKAGGIIFAKDQNRISEFYQAVIAARRLHADEEHVVLESDDFQLIVHAIPVSMAKAIEITSPPKHRDSAAIKLFFTVASLAEARIDARIRGGELFETQWQGPGFVVCDACDPEGNIFHVRETSA